MWKGSWNRKKTRKRKETKENEVWNGKEIKEKSKENKKTSSQSEDRIGKVAWKREERM